MKIPEPGWAQIVLGASGAAASVDSRIVAVFDVKWEDCMSPCLRMSSLPRNVCGLPVLFFWAKPHESAARCALDRSTGMRSVALSSDE